MDLANTLQGYRKAKLIELLVQNKVLGISEAYYNALLECKDDIHAFEEEGIQCGLPSEIREEAHRFEVDSNACVEIIVATKNIHVQATLLRDYLRSTFDENHARSLATLIPFYRKNDEALLRLLIKRLARASNDLEHRPEGREDIIAPWINKEECIRYWMEKYHVPPG